MKVKVIKGKNELPQYAHKGDAGMDLRADFSHVNDIMAHCGEWDEEREVFVLFSGGRAAIPTGIYRNYQKDIEWILDLEVVLLLNLELLYSPV